MAKRVQHRRRHVAMLDGNPDAMLDVREIAEAIGCSTSFVHRMVRDKEYPAPLHVGALSRWTARMHNEWVKNLSARHVEVTPTRRGKQSC